jgi:hypothetical protein
VLETLRERDGRLPAWAAAAGADLEQPPGQLDLGV